jgi:hypothetical protein
LEKYIRENIPERFMISSNKVRKASIKKILPPGVLGQVNLR